MADDPSGEFTPANPPNVDFKREMHSRPGVFSDKLVVNILDMLQLGSMYLPGNSTDRWNDNMIVAVDSVVYRALILLSKDPGFRVAMKLEDTTCFDAYERVVASDTGIPYIVNVPSECVWCAVGLVKNVFFQKAENSNPDYFAGMSATEMTKFLHRLGFDSSSVARIMKCYSTAPEAVVSVLEAVTAQSVHGLIATEYQKAQDREESDSEAAPETEPAIEVERDEPPNDVEGIASSVQKPLVVPNDEVARLVCEEIRTKLRGAPAAEMLCEHVTDVLAAYTLNDKSVMHVANMDAYAQSKMMNAALAQVYIFGYTLSGPNNKYNERILNALLMIDESSKPEVADKDVEAIEE